MDSRSRTSTLPRGVMLNAYPDSIGERLADGVALLQSPQLANAFSLFYILPTFFNSDLDRGFSIIDYDLNKDLVDPKDLEDLEALGIKIKLDLVLNHLSVRSPSSRICCFAATSRHTGISSSTGTSSGPVRVTGVPMASRSHARSISTSFSCANPACQRCACAFRMAG